MIDAFDSRPLAGSIKSIQRGLYSGNAGSIAIAAVNPAKTELRWLGAFASSTGSFSDTPRISLASATAISVAMSGSGPVSWELTERY